MVGPVWKWLSLAVLLAAVGCGPNPDADRPRVVTVLAAASTVDVLDELVAPFGAERSEITIRVSVGPSNMLAQQIIAGAPANVFLSASPRWAEEVRREFPGAESAPLVTNRLVLVSPATNPAGVGDLSDLLKPEVTRVAIPGQQVPAGEYAEQALAGAGVLRPLRESGKIVRGSDVRVTRSYVQRGEVEAGIVYATDAQQLDTVAIVAPIDQSTHDPIVYHAVLLTEDAAAREFFDYLQSAAARRVFAAYGFATIDTSSP